MQPGNDTVAKRDKGRRLFGKTMLYIAEALDVTPEWLMTTGLRGIVKAPTQTTRYGELLERLAMSAELDADGEAEFGPAGFTEPDRDDDEAELAELEEEDEDAKPEPVSRRAAGRGVDADAGRHAGAGRDDSEEADGDAAGDTVEDDVAEEETAPPARAAAQPPAAPQLLSGHLYRLRDFESGQWLHESLDAMTEAMRYAWRGSPKQLGMVIARNPQWTALQPERVG